ncbi:MULTISPECIES: hypothetical protein [Kaistia]|jgi:hypothetical protein|nr:MULTISPECIES: hypothetical protein [Kaistia]MCX5518667.1 hypothetical protein [Kaistia defluvii]
MNSPFARIHQPTTAEFAALTDHARLPWRFFARLLATEDRGSDRL